MKYLIAVALVIIVTLGCKGADQGLMPQVQVESSSFDGWKTPEEVAETRASGEAVIVKSDDATLPKDERPPVAMQMPKEIKNVLEPKVKEILVSISEQRLYAFGEDNQILGTFLCSTASSGVTYTKEDEGEQEDIHNHSGDFRIDRKDADHISGLYGSAMPYALHYFEGHWIHATEPSLYKHLGTPASHGCVRLNLTDAKWLYTHTGVGTSLHIE